ncbi:hypothetical protein [Phytoactinopolyspora mesophila]|uniref:Uncharacterized protein n=1 Tax=Phytoactinopolyspora mesophila TaxID=2650750 RepID=A0A7K3M100_9ACTN|nr:hypothetical protein [Phytoactinopolyspora mesophila]NDL56118.1 hypothetical protein [Phytoactinopolyspora mesophila]
MGHHYRTTLAGAGSAFGTGNAAEAADKRAEDLWWRNSALFAPSGPGTDTPAPDQYGAGADPLDDHAILAW